MQWHTQPQTTKRYPHFYRRLPLDTDNPLHRFISYCARVTLQRRYNPDTVVQLRANPSAGALYPVELYLQIKNQPGFDNGIYHYEVLSDSLVPLTYLGNQGLDAWVAKTTMEGILFFIGSPYFRSSWKYGQRALRYCFLDSGHLLGAIEASASLSGLDLPLRLHLDVNYEKLNHFFGFDDQELLTAVLHAGVTTTQNPPPLPHESLPQVVPTDYFVSDSLIDEHYQRSLREAWAPESQQKIRPHPFTEIERFETTILERRSIREFMQHSISGDDYGFIVRHALSPLPFDRAETIDYYALVHRVEGVESGLYKNQKLITAGDFQKQGRYLCLEQDLGGESAVTIFLTCKPSRYQAAMLQAGWIGHRLYLASHYLGIGCSGIGAYYDSEVQEFLGEETMILYALVIGR